MISAEEIREDLSELPAAEREELVALGGQLIGSRPLPAVSFRARLRQRLLGDRGATQAATPRPALLVAVYCGSGLLLLLLGGLGLAGLGPFAP